MGIEREMDRKGNLESTDSDFSVLLSGPMAEMWGNAQVYFLRNPHETRTSPVLRHGCHLCVFPS